MAMASNKANMAGTYSGTKSVELKDNVSNYAVGVTI